MTLATTRRLDEVCTIIMGQAPVGSSYNDRGDGVPLIAGAGDFGDGSPHPKKFTTKPGKLSQDGDIVLSIRASIGDRIVADGQYCLGRGVAGLRVLPDLTTRYLWHWLASAGSDLAAKGRGATFLQVNRADVGEMPIPVPSIDVQRRIARTLDQVGDLQRERGAAIRSLSLAKRSLFDESFGAKRSTHWKRMPLQDAVAAINDCPHSTPRWTDRGEVCLRTSNLSAGKWDWRDIRYVSDATFVERSRRGELAAGDIVLSREGTVGIAAIVPPNLRMCMGQRLVQVRPNADVLTSQYLLQFLLDSLAPDRISRVLVGSTARHLNVRELKSLEVPIPPMDVQLDYSDRVNQIDRVEELLSVSAVKLDELMGSLQAKFFSHPNRDAFDQV